MEVVGGAAAVAQLIGLCAKCIQTTTQVTESYQDAPIQIHQLATKIDWLQFCIGQIRDLGEGLPDEDFDKLLPAPHRVMLLMLLQRHHDQLLDIEGVGVQVSSGKRPKLRWALLSKRKAAGIMQGLEEIQQMLIPTLSIMNFRLTTLNHTSLGLLNLSHSAMVPAFEARTQEMMNSLRCLKDDQEEIVQALSLRRTPLLSHKLTVVAKAPRRPDTDPDTEDRVDELLCLADLESNEILYHSSWSFRGHSRAQDKRLGLKFSAQLTQHYRKARTSIRLPFYFLGDRILNFELGVRQFTRAWTSVSFTDCQMRVVNVRPKNSPIFQLCQESDFDGVKSMLEEGRASVSDVDNLNNAGLLEYTLTSTNDAFSLSHREREKPMLKLVNYLLQQGCNSAAFNSSVEFSNELSTAHPVIVQALFWGYPNVLRMLVQNGFSFETEENPASRLFGASPSGFREQLAILLSLGLVIPGLSSNFVIFNQAVEYGCTPEIIYAIEVLKVTLDAKNPDFQSCRSILPNMFCGGVDVGMGMGAIFQQYGLGLSSHPKLHSHIATAVQAFSEINSNHRYLFLDQSCSLAQTFTASDSPNIHSPWSDFWWKSLRPTSYIGGDCKYCGSGWDFESVVNEVEHLARHGAPVSTPLSEPYSDRIRFGGRRNYQMQLKCEDVARSWSYSLNDDSVNEPSRMVDLTNELDAFFEQDDHRLPGVPIYVYEDGWIEKNSNTGNSSPKHATSKVHISGLFGLGHVTDTNPDQNFSDEHGSRIIDEDDGENMGDEGDDATDEKRRNGRLGLFASVISTREGRRHLLRFPLVKAVCCALQRVGYRVDMDDEGDLWYEDDDGDPYFDAVENLRDLDHEPGPLGGTCKICRNPREHGLGQLVDKMEDGLVEWRHEREKFVRRGALQEDNFVWPSWTRKGGYQ